MNSADDILSDRFTIFLAGIMQGSHQAALVHPQDYRGKIRELLARYFPRATIYDPLENHGNSLEYDDEQGRSVFLRHNRMCRDVDVLLAFVPEASMGTAIEMWEAHQHGKIVIVVSPLIHNWTVKYVSHLLYEDLAALHGALERGELQRRLAELLKQAPVPFDLDDCGETPRG